MRRVWFVVTLMLLPAPAVAASWLQCDQSELKDPSCTALSVNYTPLYFTAGCIECSGGGSDINCAPGEKVTPQTLGVETVTGNQPVAGTFSQQGTCDFSVPLWKFTGSFTKGVAYNVVLTVTGHPKMKLLTFTTGTSTPAVDSSVPPPPGDGGGTTTGDGGGTPTGDGGGAPGTDGGGSPSGDGSGGNNGGDEDGCSCHVAAHPTPTLLILLGFAVLALRPRRR